jgi:hypothetical protein
MNATLKRIISIAGCILLLLTIPIATLPTYAQTDERCFDEVPYCISGRIRTYWEQNGGLPVFGLPITPQQEETIDGQTLHVQWFERNRLELHTENAPPYDVLLGRLGGNFVEQSGAAAREEPRDGCAYFEQTGFNVCGDILTYWQSNGLELDGQAGKTMQESLALFGFPLTGEFETTMADGSTRTVQWFERARFELHPENDPPFNVLLGRLGVEVAGEPETTPPTAPEEPTEDPMMDDHAAIEAAVRAHAGDLNLAYTVEDICIDSDFATATVMPVERGMAESIAFVLQRSDGQWQVIFGGQGMRLLGAAFRQELGIPADFACLSEPMMP